MNYKNFNLGDWIGHISGVIEDESELDGNEMRDLVEFLSMLKQKPCDAISRQAVLDIAKSSKSNWIDNSVLFKRVNELPSVTPQYTDAEIQKMQELEQAEIEKAYELGKASQPKIGHWIYTLEDWNKWECSECGFTKRTDVHVSIGYKYCPSCGAKMEREVKS
jgi:hypothetical protein